jgi:hypothetical protein
MVLDIQQRMKMLRRIREFFCFRYEWKRMRSLSLFSLFRLAVKYLFLANDGTDGQRELDVEPFNASHEQNDYEVSWPVIVQFQRIVD